VTGLGVIFDLDGTLVTLDVDIERVRHDLAAYFGPRGYGEVFRPVLARIDEAAAQVAADEREREALVARAWAVLDAAEMEAASRAQACEHAAEVLSVLLDNNIPVGIVTNNGRSCLERALASAGLAHLEQFAVAITRDEAARPKPDPEGLVCAATTLLPGGGTLWFVGDSPIDAASAEAARARLRNIDLHYAAVPVAAGEQTAADTSENAADAALDHRLADLAQLMELLV
jgi:phosphoglycolate phosphatase